MFSFFFLKKNFINYGYHFIYRHLYKYPVIVILGSMKTNYLNVTRSYLINTSNFLEMDIVKFSESIAIYCVYRIGSAQNKIISSVM